MANDYLNWILLAYVCVNVLVTVTSIYLELGYVKKTSWGYVVSFVIIMTLFGSLFSVASSLKHYIDKRNQYTREF